MRRSVGRMYGQSVGRVVSLVNNFCNHLNILGISNKIADIFEMAPCVMKCLRIYSNSVGTICISLVKTYSFEALTRFTNFTIWYVVLWIFKDMTILMYTLVSLKILILIVTVEINSHYLHVREFYWLTRWR